MSSCCENENETQNFIMIERDIILKRWYNLLLNWGTSSIQMEKGNIDTERNIGSKKIRWKKGIIKNQINLNIRQNSFTVIFTDANRNRWRKGMERKALSHAGKDEQADIKRCKNGQVLGSQLRLT